MVLVESYSKSFENDTLVSIYILVHIYHSVVGFTNQLREKNLTCRKLPHQKPVATGTKLDNEKLLPSYLGLHLNS